MEIKDKTINICICGKSRKTIKLEGYDRMLGWVVTIGLASAMLGVIVKLGVSLQAITAAVQTRGLEAVVAYALVIYAVIYLVIRVAISRKQKHSLLCSLRMAWLKFAYW